VSALRSAWSALQSSVRDTPHHLSSASTRVSRLPRHDQRQDPPPSVLATGQAEFGSGESEMWDERITRRAQREEGLVATALHEPISGAIVLDHAHDVPWEEVAPGEVISKVIRALEHTGCVALP
jgi:hypothetical protein